MGIIGLVLRCRVILSGVIAVSTGSPAQKAVTSLVAYDHVYHDPRRTMIHKAPNVEGRSPSPRMTIRAPSLVVYFALEHLLERKHVLIVLRCAWSKSISSAVKRQVDISEKSPVQQRIYSSSSDVTINRAFWVT